MATKIFEENIVYLYIGTQDVYKFMILAEIVRDIL